MNFLKHSMEYVVNYNKIEAVKELLKDKRVKKIAVFPKSILIYTHPIKLITTMEKIIPYNITYIGSYIIRIRQIFNKLRINFKSDLYRTHIHCHIGGFANGTVCWGNMETAINEMCDNKDWFWVGKTCLDLLENGDDDVWEVSVERMLRLQIKYSKNIKDKITLQKLKKLVERLDVKS